MFVEIVRRYTEALELAVKRSLYRVDTDNSRIVRELADRLGDIRARPRDVVDVHVRALTQLTASSTPGWAAHYAEEGRLVALELMGHLAAYYRTRCLLGGKPWKGAGDE